MKVRFKRVGLVLARIVMGIGLLAVASVWATDWPPNPEPATQWEKWICARHDGYGYGSCTHYNTCVSNDLECSQYGYLYRADMRAYGTCSGYSDSGQCVSYPEYCCAYIRYSELDDCTDPATDCDTWVWVGPNICEPLIGK